MRNEPQASFLPNDGKPLGFAIHQPGASGGARGARDGAAPGAAGSRGLGLLVLAAGAALVIGAAYWMNVGGALAGGDALDVHARNTGGATVIDTVGAVSRARAGSARGAHGAVVRGGTAQSTSRQAYESGRSCVAHGRYAEAVRHLVEAVESDPGFADARYSLALAYYRTGSIEAARHEKASLEAIDPSLASLLGNLVR